MGPGREASVALADSTPKCGDVTLGENVGTSPGFEKMWGRRLTSPHFFPPPKCGDVAKMWGRRKMWGRHPDITMIYSNGNFPRKTFSVRQRVIGDGRITRNVALAHGLY